MYVLFQICKTSALSLIWHGRAKANRSPNRPYSFLHNAAMGLSVHNTSRLAIVQMILSPELMTLAPFRVILDRTKKASAESALRGLRAAHNNRKVGLRIYFCSGMTRSSSHNSNIRQRVKQITISTNMVVSRRPSGGGRLFSFDGLAGTTSTILIAASTFLLLNIGTVDAHGYLMSPRSRNFLAHSSQDGKGQYGSTAADPKVDYEVRFFLACYFLDNAISTDLIHKYISIDQ